MTTADRIRKIVIEHLDCVGPADAATFESLGADSLDNVELVMAIEEEFDISIPDDETFKIDTIGKAVAYVDKKLANT